MINFKTLQDIPFSGHALEDRGKTVTGGVFFRNTDTDETMAAIGLRRPDNMVITMVISFDDYMTKLHGRSLHMINGYVGARMPQGPEYVHRLILESFDDTVDHINRVKYDNRQSNLRVADMSDQNSNRDTRCDKKPPPQELLDIGITELPRGIRWDFSEARFTGYDISFLRDLRLASGKGVDCNGTKSSKCSLLEKFASCMVVTLEALHAYRAAFPKEATQSNAFNMERIHRLDEYFQIATFCHEQRPTVFDAPSATAGMDDLSRMSLTEHVDFLLKKVCKQLAITPQQAAALGGPKDQVVTLSGPASSKEREGATPPSNIIIREKSSSKGEVLLTLLDAKYLSIWERKNEKGASLVNWDASDQRIHVYPELCRAFPKIKQVFGDVTKISLGEFVYHVLEGNPRRADHTIVPMNQQRNDVRAANLEELPGIGKNYKASTVVPPPGVDIGMPYVPRGVSISMDRSAFLFSVSTADKKRKVGFTVHNAAKRFASEVLPLLQASAGGVEEFNRRNKVYQLVTQEYFGAINKA